MKLIQDRSVESTGKEILNSRFILPAVVSSVVNIFGLLFIPPLIRQALSGNTDSFSLASLLIVGLVVTVSNASYIYSSGSAANYLCWKLQHSLITACKNSANAQNKDLINQFLSSDLDKLSSFVAGNLLKAPAYVLMICFAVPKLVALHAWVVIILAVLIAVGIQIARLGYRRLSSLQQEEIQTRGETTRRLSLFLENQNMVRINESLGSLIQGVGSSCKINLGTKQKITLTRAVISPINESLVSIAGILYVFLSLLFIDFNWISLPDVIETTSYLAILSSPVIAAVGYVADRSRHQSIFDSFCQLLSDLQAASTPQKVGINLETDHPEFNFSRYAVTEGSVQFNTGLSISYPKLELLPGEPTALIGVTGIGKTTYLLALSGIYPDKESRPSCANGVADLALSRRKKMIYLPQIQKIPSTNFNECVKVICGEGRSDRKKLFQILHELSVHSSEFADIEKQKLTTLSGGQQQRLMLAIAMSSSADIYLFDEPMASLDSLTSLKVAKCLDALSKGSIVIYSTHSSPTPNSNIYDLEKP